MTESRNEFIASTQEKLDVLDAKIAELQAKVQQGQGETRRDFKKVLSDLWQHRDKAERRITDLRNAGDSAWQDLREGAENSWRTLSDAVEQASRRFQ